MDLITAIAASMLPASRAAVAAAFKEHRHALGCGVAALESLSRIAGRGAALDRAAIVRLLDRARRAAEQAGRSGIHPVFLDDPAYPALLRCIDDPPPVLWVRGAIVRLTTRAAAVVGSRAATPYAVEVAERLAAGLAAREVAVVSGLARGVDSAAHRGCLASGGCTVAVLGSGPDRIYPAEHATLADAIAERGVVMSELAPGAPPRREHFPLRNRIISGTALATIVVEASEQSGSLITARCALEQGRDVMAVPGSVLSGRNRGSHSLLKDGARVVETADDILQELGWISAVRASPRGSGRSPDPVLGRMASGESYSLDELVVSTGCEPVRLLARLTELELDGRVTVTAGRFLRRA
jgi:DNA processing protein